MPEVGGRPLRRSHVSGKFDWAPIVELLHENPDVEVLADELTQVSNVRALRNTVRQGGVTVLRELGGIIIPSIRDSALEDAKPLRYKGNLWLKWVPNGSQDDYYASVYVERDKRRNPDMSGI